MLGQVAALGEFLGVQEINVSIFQNLPVEGLILDGNALIQIDFVRLEVNLHPGLGIEFRRIGKPYEDSLRLFREVSGPHKVGLLDVKLIAEEDALHKRCHNDGLTGASRCGERDYLGRKGCAVTIRGAHYF